MLDAQDQHPSGTQLAGVVNALGVINILTRISSFYLRPKKEALPRESGNASKIGTKSETENTADACKDDFFFSILLSPFLSFFGIV